MTYEPDSKTPIDQLVNYDYVEWNMRYVYSKVCNKLHGEFRMFYPNGQQSVSKMYVYGEQHGLNYEWQSSGMRTARREYYKGKRHGLETVWNADGSIRHCDNYFHGQLHGVCHEYLFGRSWSVQFDMGRVCSQYMCIKYYPNSFYRVWYRKLKNLLFGGADTFKKIKSITYCREEPKLYAIATCAR